MDIMIDLETLGTKYDAVVLSIGAVKFDPYSDAEPSQAFYMKLNVDEQVALGREIHPDTVNWWSQQKPEVREEALSDDNRESLEDFSKGLNKFLVGCNDIWAHGPAFDIVIIEDLYRQLGKPIPWQFWQIRDSRTLFNLTVDPRKSMNMGEAHNALADCIYQAKGVQQVFKQFDIKPKFQRK
jgi:hypothetical protein